MNFDPRDLTGVGGETENTALWSSKTHEEEKKGGGGGEEKNMATPLSPTTV